MAGRLSNALVAWWKMNENTANDNAELVTNGNFSAWTGDNPDSWTVTGEVTTDPEISEVGTGEGHGGVGTGYCNIYTSDGTNIKIAQTVSNLTVGRKYKFSITINKVTAGTLFIFDSPTSMFADKTYSTTGTKTFTFIATATSINIFIGRFSGATDITFDDVSIKLLAVEDSSGRDHDGLAQQATDQIHRVGKINGAFDFTPNDYIEIADHADFTPALTPFSISAWVYMHDATMFTIASKGVYNTDGEWDFRFSAADKVFIRQMDESVADCYIGRVYNTALTSYENQWIHLVATYDGGITSASSKIYLNATRIDDSDTESNAGSFTAIEDLNHDVWIGRYDSAYANGLIDNLMFFGIALSQSEVSQLYAAGRGVGKLTDLDHSSRLHRSRRRYY